MKYLTFDVVVTTQFQFGPFSFLANFSIRIPNPNGARTYEGTIEKVRDLYPREKLLEQYMKGSPIDETIQEKTSFEIVWGTIGRWQPGVYYAHEYDAEAEGRIRVRSYNNGFKTYEVECLNKALHVLDGIWEEPDGNGCGDRFYSLKPLKGAK